MIGQILQRHRMGNLSDGIPNPTLEQMCELVSRAAAFITPAVQRKAFKQTGLTLATDGSQDDAELSPELKALLRKYNLDLVPTDEYVSTQFFSRTAIRYVDVEPSIQGVFKQLCADAAKAKFDEFFYEPTPTKVKKDTRWVESLNSNKRCKIYIMKYCFRHDIKQGNCLVKLVNEISLRFKCSVGCSVEYASKHYHMAKVHLNDCPTRAFLGSGWRPFSKSWLASKGFFVRSDAVVEEEACLCPDLACQATVHLVE